MTNNYPPVTMQDLFSVAKTMYGETVDLDVQLRLAVAWVIRTRAARYAHYMLRLGRDCTPHVYRHVCVMGDQFHCWLPEHPQHALLVNDDALVHDATFAYCVLNAMAVLGGHTMDPTDGATHYCGAAWPIPSWARDPADATRICEQLVTWRYGTLTFLCVPEVL